MINDILKNKFDELIEQYGEDRILWVAAMPVTDLKSSFEAQIPISACYLPTHQELYLTYPLVQYTKDEIIDIRLLKNNLQKLILSPYKYINPKYETLLIDNLFNNTLIFTDDLALYKAIVNIVDHSLDVPSSEQELLNVLTKTEIQVLKNIINKFDTLTEGNIKVSNQSVEWNISTSVFRTLFYKLKEYKVAEVTSCGVNGTHIKFNNMVLLKSLIDKF